MWLFGPTKEEIKDANVEAVHQLVAPQYFHERREETIRLRRPSKIVRDAVSVPPVFNPEPSLAEFIHRQTYRIETWKIVYDDMYQVIDNPFTGEKSRTLVYSDEIKRYLTEDKEEVES